MRLAKCAETSAHAGLENIERIGGGCLHGRLKLAGVGK